MSLAFAFTRIGFARLPDRIGGVRTTILAALLEATGQTLIGVATNLPMAVLGATLTGAG